MLIEERRPLLLWPPNIEGHEDSLEEYQRYLKDVKAYQLPGGKSQISEPKYTKTKSINGQQWVDALHLASEVPGFYTRYLATVKEDLGVAVTFSVTKDLYSAYQGIFDNVVASLRVFRQKKQNLADIKLGGSKDGDANFEDTTFAPTDPNFDIGVAKKKRSDESGEGGDGLLLLLIGLAVAAFIILKLKKKK